MEIEALVRAVLGSEHVEKVLVQEDFDRSGERILRVTVVYDSNAGDLDSEKMLLVSESVLENVFANEGYGFPVLTFVSKQDMNTLHAAE